MFFEFREYTALFNGQYVKRFDISMEWLAIGRYAKRRATRIGY